MGRVGLKALRLISLIVIFPLSASADRDLNATETRKLAKFEAKCVASKKKKSVCRCVGQHVKQLILSRDIDDERLDHVVLIASGRDLDEEEKPSYYDSLADLIQGLEYRCQGKSK